MQFKLNYDWLLAIISELISNNYIGFLRGHGIVKLCCDEVLQVVFKKLIIALRLCYKDWYAK